MKKFEDNEIESTERREVLAALLKYSAAVGGASMVVLSASDAVARSASSGYVRNDRRKERRAERRQTRRERRRDRRQARKERRRQRQHF